MTQPVREADIRGFDAALGIQLPHWAAGDASVRCFADPAAHARGDRNPSCSINLTHGAWNCHGCGASGGPFDAAIDQGHTSRSAIALMISYGLAQRRAPSAGPRLHTTRASASRHPRPNRALAARITISEADINRWRHALECDAATLARLARERGWRLEAMRELELGLDRGSITIPVRDQGRRLVGLLRYRPFSGAGEIKMRAALGSRRQLLPHPAAERSAQIWLVEGELDMIAARSRGLPAVPVPGCESWQPDWTRTLRGRAITVVLDCDARGRAAARRTAHDLDAGARTRIADLAPERDDGFDLTDWLTTRAPADLEQFR